MESKFKPLLHIIMVFLFILHGCRSKYPKISDDLQTSFEKMFPIVDMNNSIEIFATPVDTDEFEFESDILVVIQNNSNNSISFPPDYGNKLYIVDGDKWTEIKNNNIYYGENPLIYPKGEQEVRDKRSTRIRPLIADRTKIERSEKTILRIVIMGELITDNTPVGAYIDIFISP